MVTWGFISDVHGNLAALASALTLLERAGAVRLAFLGDYLGKGLADECVSVIRGVASVAVVGNRDLDWAPLVSSASREWVESLPRMCGQDGLIVAHGDARLTPALSTAQIKREFAKSWDLMQQHGAVLAAFGHSHHARVWEKFESAGKACLAPPDGEVWMHPQARYLLNVGTTGMPFPGKGAATVALANLEKYSIRLLGIDRSD